MKLLITAGGTKEPIDSVRYISNISTGATGLFLTKACLNANHTVTLLTASDVLIPRLIKSSVQLDQFTTFKQLKEMLIFYLSSYHFDIVIHLAAVCDYFISNVFIEGVKIKNKAIAGKISKAHSITLNLKPNPKLLPKLKSFSQNKKLFVVGFKLTDTKNTQQEEHQIQDLLSNEDVDIVVHNRMSDITEKQHIAKIYSKQGLLRAVQTKRDMSKGLLDVFKKAGI